MTTTGRPDAHDDTAAITRTLRPRIEGEREAEILDAALELLASSGYDRLTMDAVASAAKASKATLYRRWDTKAELVVDALSRAKGAPQLEPIDTGSLRGDLIGRGLQPRRHQRRPGARRHGQRHHGPAS